MTKPWRYQTTQDRLRIFVSSRIQECKAERKTVQEAIRSLGHEPVLFEHLGARPYSPRDLYLSRLRDSQAMVAIYRSGYGYIDVTNGMEISGLEDEYLFAKQEGKDTLYYIWHSEEGRDQRLQLMINEILGGPSVSYYNDPEKLSERVKEDISAWITSKVLDSLSYSGVMQENSSAVLGRTLNSVGFIVRRAGLIGQIVEKIKCSPVLCICGPAGIGKTTASALLAQSTGSIFVRLSGLTPKEVFSVCADVLKGVPAKETTLYSTLEGARLAVAAAWAELSNVTLVLDECDYITELIDALSTTGGMTLDKRIVYTSREASLTLPHFEIPPLLPTEINEMIANSPWLHKAETEKITEGNPLSLQHKLMHLGTRLSEDILNIGGSAGEILTYLALTPIPLNAEQLISLRADDNYSIHSLSADIERLGRIIDDSPRGFRLMHAETSAAVAERTKVSPQRYGFFINRLIRLTEELGCHRFSYELAAKLEDGSAKKYATQALHEAASLGDWRVAIPLVDRMLSEALDAESKNESLQLMLSLVYPLELTGNAERASDILTRATELANQLSDTARFKVEETEVSSRARRALLANDVNALQEIYSRYLEQGKKWDQARIGLELSAIYLAAKNAISAIDILRPTLTIFEELGDEYGIDLAQRNLASALSAIPGNEEEAEKLITIITERIEEEPDKRRQRAWLCNILTRRLRTSGRYEEAKAVAEEALEIAKDLGDEALSAINHINLGNVYRGLKQPQNAIAMYDAAAAISQKCGRRDIEADASRLVAGIYNDFEEMEEPSVRFQKAKYYAQHSIGLFRGSVNSISLACAKWELGEALESLGDTKEAANAFFESALAYRMALEPDDFSAALNYAVNLSLPDHVKTYLKGIADALGIKQTDSQQALVDQFLNLLVPIMEAAPKRALIRLLSAHIGEVWSHLPPPLRQGLVKFVVTTFKDFALKQCKSIEHWRVLHSAIVIASLLKDTNLPYLYQELASSITEDISDIFAREEGDGTRVWTLILNIKRRITVSIACLDTTPASNLAAFALAVFIKAFEAELANDIVGRMPSLDELLIQIGLFDAMPEDLQKATQSIGLIDILKNSPCTVSRPTSFNEFSPTCVFLSSSFLKEVSFGDVSGSAFQLLFGLTLTEIAFQLLHGEVEMDEIRPKIISLVRNASY